MTRIQELAEQAKNSIPKDSLGVSEWIAAYNQKFAELIVRECAEIGDGYDNETKYNQGLIDIQTAGDEIRKHFGVEE